MSTAASITREEQKRRTRDSILFAARGLFVAQGYTATTVDKIARAAGVSRQGFYLHYRGKGEIAQDLMAMISPDILADFTRLDDIDDPTPEALVAWLTSHAQLWQRYRMEFAAMEQALATDDDVAGSWYEFYGEITEAMPRTLNAQRHSGASESLARARLRTMFAAVERTFHFLIIRDRDEDFDDELTVLAELLERIIIR